jgi:hypothetical protein
MLCVLASNIARFSLAFHSPSLLQSSRLKINLAKARQQVRGYTHGHSTL